jgi:hypothetical protein
MSPYSLTDIEQMKSENNLEGLSAALASPEDPELRQAAAAALGSIGGEPAARALCLGLNGADDAQQSAIVDALSAIKDVNKILPELLEDPEEKVKTGAMLGTLFLMGKRSGSKPASKTKPGKPRPFLVKIVVFCLGVAIWVIPTLILSGLSSLLKIGNEGVWVFIFFVWFIVAAVIAAKGWNTVFVNKRGERENAYKVVIVCLIAITIIGMIWVFYWTGVGALKLYYREE